MRLTIVAICLTTTALSGFDGAAGRGELFPTAQAEQIRRGLRDIYNLDHDSAAAIFQKMIDSSPGDPAGYTFLATTLWRHLLAEKQELTIDRFAASDFFNEQARPFVQVEPAIERRFVQLSDSAISAARERTAHSIEDNTTRFLLGLIYQNLATYEASLRRSWWAAFRHGVRAYGYHRDLLRMNPECHDARLAPGVFTYVTGRLDWRVRWMALLMGYRGSQEGGKEQLQLTARNNGLCADDARVILALILTREQNYSQAYALLAELLQRYPKNYLFQLDMAKLWLLMKQPVRAVREYEDIERKRQAAQPNFQKVDAAVLYSRIGIASRDANSLEESAEWLRRALAEPRISEKLAAVVHLELGKTLLLLGRREQAASEFRIAAGGPDVGDTRQQAQKLLRRATD